MITNETWKKVKGFNNFEVSDKGRIRNIKLGLIKSQRKTKTGYMCISYCLNGKQKTAGGYHWKVVISDNV